MSDVYDVIVIGAGPAGYPGGYSSRTEQIEGGVRR